MAAYRSLCQLGSILSCWNPCRCHPCLLVTLARDWPMDWYTGWCFHPNNSARHCYKLHKLGETGK
ncbi:hypothetical protein E1A91_A03G165600v1 [Gossypium mustelinum]|uniref:Uncharacterized protein n=1 Tax=Gossypium mustelinum TaxID=34275 RepID=A0A5D2ZZU9_GOSMU|nr:hypothetical protein E1A91_A03G165600v1 [Gossypium mustelinum]